MMDSYKRYVFAVFTASVLFCIMLNPVISDSYLHRTVDVMEADILPTGDSFNNTDDLGWELLEGNSIIHAWNKYDDYYFNNSDGIQFSNHYEEYWTRNVMMLGYYAGETWNLLYRTDSLSGFNRIFEGETDGYMNLTLWKDLSYGSYDFRLAIRYHLKPDDVNLTVIPYIKNLGIEIPYNLGFGWEMKDINIGGTFEDDYFRHDGSSNNSNATVFELHNDSLDWSSSNLTYWYTDDSQDWHWNPNAIFNLDDHDSNGDINKTLYLDWDDSLAYLLQVKARSGQYNAPVTLFIRAGSLAVNQEKYTTIYWYDADTTYGTLVQFSSSSVAHTHVTTLSSSKFVACWLDVSTSYGYGCVGSILEGTAFEWGTPTNFETDAYVDIAYSWMDISTIDTNKVVISYVDDGGLNDAGYSVVGTISGATIGYGTPVTFSGGGDAEIISSCPLDTNKFVVFYDDESNSDTGTCCVGTVSGTTITFGSETDVSTTDYYPRYTDCYQLDTDKFIVFFYSSDNARYYACVGTVSGTTITFGTVYEVFNPSPYDNLFGCSVVAFDTDDVAFFYACGYSSTMVGELHYKVADISGTTISLGSDHIFEDSSIPNHWYPNQAVMLDSTHALVVFPDGNGSQAGVSRLATFDDTGNTLSFGTTDMFESGATGGYGDMALDVCYLGSEYVVVVYQDDADSDRGKGIVGQVSLTEPEETSVDTISPYNLYGTQYDLTVTESGDPDNITLWYRYNTDNTTWDGGAIVDETNDAVDTNDTDVDTSEDIGIEENFSYAQGTTPDSSVMTLTENDTSMAPLGMGGSPFESEDEPRIPSSLIGTGFIGPLPRILPALGYDEGQGNVTILYPGNNTVHGDGYMTFAYIVTDTIYDVTSAELIDAETGEILANTNNVDNDTRLEFYYYYNTNDEFSVYVNATSNGYVLTSDVINFEIDKGLADVYGCVNDYDGTIYNTTIELLEEGTENVLYSSVDKQYHNLTVDDDNYDVNITFINHEYIQNIFFEKDKIKKNKKKISQISGILSGNGYFQRLFSTNSTDFDVDDLTFNVKTAVGSRLYYSADWDFETQTGTWEFYDYLDVGEPYSFVLPDNESAFKEIQVVNAWYLDDSKNIVSDVYDEIKEQDGIWTNKIYEDEYLRVQFEHPLTSVNDITIYVRNNDSLTTTVEVYYNDSDTLITTFPTITYTGFYKIYLTGMSGANDTFDLKVINSDPQSTYLDFDYVIDPEISWYDDFESGAVAESTVNSDYWQDVGGSDDWLWGDGDTPSSNTGCGVSSSCQLAKDGTYNIYIESSSSHYNLVSYLESDEFTLSATDNLTLDFWYHMYGQHIAWLSVEIDYGGDWDVLWNLSGQQDTSYACTDPWNQGYAYAEDGVHAPYTGTHKLRFVAKAGTSYYGDICVDAVWLNVTTGGPDTTPEIIMNSPANMSAQDSSPVSLSVSVANGAGEDMYVNWYGDEGYLGQNITNGNETVEYGWDCGSGFHYWNVTVNTTSNANGSGVRWFAIDYFNDTFDNTIAVESYNSMLYDDGNWTVEETGGGDPDTYNDTVNTLSPDYRWMLNGNEDDCVDGADTDTATPPSWVDNIIPNGVGSQCGDYDGSTDKTGIPNQADINTATTYEKSVFAWIETDTIDTSNGGRIIWGEGGTSNGFTIYVYDVGGEDRLYACVYESTNIDYCYSTISTGTVYLVGATLDCSAGELILYVNGAEVASDTSLMIGSDFAAHSAGAGIGGADSNLNNHDDATLSGFFDGRIADVTYYAEQTVLTESDFTDIYEAGTSMGSSSFLGNITSVNITKPSEATWNEFYAEVNNTANSTFSILDNTTGDVIMSGLNGDGDDISSLTNNSIKLFGEFDGDVLFGSWNVNWETEGVTANYEINFEYQWTSADYDETYEYVCIYVDSHTGNDNLNVFYYNSGWNSLGTISSTGWNNFTATGLTSSTYTICLNDTVTTSDTTQDNWDIDCIFLHTWSESSAISFIEWDNSSNPDTESPWGWTFDFPNGTGYYEFYSIGNYSGVNESPPSSADAICHITITNDAPYFITNSEYPSNGLTNVLINPTLYVTVNDNTTTDSVNVTWYWNDSGTWMIFAVNLSIPHAQLPLNISQVNDANFSSYSTTYDWSVNVSDGYNYSNVSFSFTTMAQDTTPPTITINFAGNLGDKGGPYWRPPDETTQLTGVFSDGYYTNNSRQSENWIYVNTTVTDTETPIIAVWLNWYNKSSDLWINWTYGFSNPSGDYWDYNSSGNIVVSEGNDYSFDVVANSSGGTTIDQWNKTGIIASFTRRYVQLGCSQTNISYSIFYLFNPIEQYGDISHEISDLNMHDHLHSDQGADGTIHDTGYLINDTLASTIDMRWCNNFVGYWFDDEVCTLPIDISNVYIHVWLSSNSADRTAEIRTSRECLYTNIPCTSTTVNKADKVTNITYDQGEGTVDNTYYLHAKLISIGTPIERTDNNIYEFNVIFNDTSQQPSTISNTSVKSFILLNVPDNDTLNVTDTDSDLLDDWEELFVTHTSPFHADTDSDGVSDYDEDQASTDPNNYSDYPISEDTEPPSIAILFAGNPGDVGGPYFPDNHTGSATSSNLAANGYYTNSSWQLETFMNISANVTDNGVISSVLLHLCEDGSWDNSTWVFTNQTGDDIWYCNVTGLSNNNYSFDIYATDGTNSVIAPWDKQNTSTNGGYNGVTRRWVRMSGTASSLNNTLLYLHEERYYLVGTGATPLYDCFRHDQGTDFGGGTDAGVWNETLPKDDSTEELIYCTSYTAAWFDKTITVPKTIFDNIYLHIWWNSSDGVLENIGAGGPVRDRFISADINQTYASNAAGAKSNITCYIDDITPSNNYFTDGDYEFHLECGKYELPVDINLTDNSIYQYFVGAGGVSYPKLLSNLSIQSFIIFNLPDNSTLAEWDNDSDNLNNYEELFVTFTNPYMADTDNDGISDYLENISGSDPNNYTDAIIPEGIDVEVSPMIWDIGEVYLGGYKTENFTFWQNGSSTIDITIGVNSTNFTFVSYSDWLFNGYNRWCANYTDDNWASEDDITPGYPPSSVLKTSQSPGSFEFGVRVWLPRTMSIQMDEDFEIVLVVSEST